ncbi:type II secretion system F family protein [Betaproteobacteria bacterium SCN2]|jgi:tight adherence protein B|nr:type II secretion system F family protein [Betaproteobacteria bacterium SCN2]
MDIIYIVLIVLGFIALVLFFEGLYLSWNSYRGPEARRIERRLQAMSAGAHGSKEASLVKQRLLSDEPWLAQLLLSLPRVHQMDRLLQQSGLPWNMARFQGLTLAAAVTGLLFGLIMGFPWQAVLILTLAFAAVPFLYVYNSKQKRLEKLEQQLPDALDMMSRAMQAGHAFPGALQMVGNESPEPTAGEFKLTFDEINYGIPLHEALLNLATRVPSTDLRYFVIAVLVQRETGGNLSEILGKISKLIRERLKLMATIKVLSAEGRLSAWILSILPFVLAILISIINPKLMSMLWTDETGRKMIAGALTLMIIGVFWMWRMIKIRV